MAARRISISCDVCAPSTRPGLLWLGGSDWVECPQCVGGQVEIVEEHVKPRGKLFIAGSTHGATIFDPRHARRFS